MNLVKHQGISMCDPIQQILEMEPDQQYEVRVQQLELQDMTRSDAQGVADVEDTRGTLLENIKLDWLKAPVDLTTI